MVEYINVGDFNHQFDAYILKCSKMEIHHEKSKKKYYYNDMCYCCIR